MLLNILTFALLLLNNPAHSVTFDFNYVSKPESFVVIKGTSSLHDWTMKGEAVVADADIVVDQNMQLKEIRSFNGEVPIKNLKSGKFGMDGIAYDALKEEKFPIIKFFLKTIDEIDPVTKQVTAQFNVTIAGVTKPMEIQGVYTDLKNGELKIIGEKKMKMSEFKVDAPTAMFGTIKTGDEIAIEFNMVMKSKKN